MININIIRKIALIKPNDIAWISREQVMSWVEFATAVHKCTTNLSRYQYTKTIRACYIADNSIEMGVLLASLVTLGVPTVGLDYTGDVSQWLSQIKEIKSRLLIYSSAYANRVQQLLDLGYKFDLLVTIGNDIANTNHVTENTDLVTYNNLIDDSIYDFMSFQTPNRQFESISFTSGTSGVPKAVIRTFSFDSRRFNYMQNRFNFNEHDRYLVSLPFFHVSTTVWARLFLNLGATVVLGSVNNAVSLYNMITSYKITATLLVPPVLNKLIYWMESNKIFAPQTLQFLLVGGKYFPYDLKRRVLRQFGAIVHEYYGSTETGVNTLSDLADLDNRSRLNSVGRPIEGNKIIIIDKNSRILPAGKIGRIAVYSYMNMDKYFTKINEELILDDKRFLLTPDYGYLDEIGYLFLTERYSGSSTERGQYNIYHLEDIIRTLSGIDDVVVLTLSPYDGSAVINLAVAISDGNLRSILEDQIKEHLKTFDVNVICGKIIFLNELPYNLSGKVKIKEISMLL